MISARNFRTKVSCLILLSIILGITLTYATEEALGSKPPRHDMPMCVVTNPKMIMYASENACKMTIKISPEYTRSSLVENGYKASVHVEQFIEMWEKESGRKALIYIDTQGTGGSLRENGYKLDLTSEEAFLDLPDVAITDIMLSKTVVGQGYATQISITISNKAFNYETFNLIIKANTTTIKTQTITLTGMKATTTTFTWNTTGFAKGSYTISAYAWPVPGEIDTTDNTYIGGTVFVAMPCDIASKTRWDPNPLLRDRGLPDGRVDYKDVFWFLKAYGSDPSKSNWVPECDVAGGTTWPPAPPDDIVNYKDIFWLLRNYGQVDP